MTFLRRLWSRYEAYLLIGPDDGSGDRVRARAIYVLAWAIAFIEIVNLAAITAFKSLYSVEAAVCLFVVAAAFLAAASLRWRRNFTPYAVGAALVGVGAPLATAVYDYTGVNSALLPMMVATPMVVAFIGGPRLALAAGAAGFAVIWLLYAVSVNAPVPDAPFYAERNLQRAIHAAAAIFVVAVTAAVVSANAFRTLRRLEERTARAIKAEAAKTEFLATMSHELRTPMNGVLGLADALALGDHGDAVRESAETIRRSGHSLLRILNDILDLSKIEAGKIEFVCEPFSPHALARDIAAQWREAAALKGVRVEATVCAQTPACLEGDALRIGQILSNLVSNAVKFTPSGFVLIAVSSRPLDDGRVQLRAVVRDTGPGVPADARERIFAPFEQANGGIARAHGGTGLGLAISQRLATMMGGALRLAPGGPGATFVFEAAFSRADAQHALQTEAEQPRAVPRRALSVLAVDDNAVNRLVVARLLELLGHSCALAESGAECLALMAREPFDVVLMDKNMPAMSGVEAIQRLRAVGGDVARTPVIACTADAVDGEREALLKAGFDGFVAKPLSVQALSAALEAATALTEPARLTERRATRA